MAKDTVRRVLVIDAKRREVSEGCISDLASMQELVGGNIQRGQILDNGDEVFVNEEGLFGSPTAFFYIDGGAQPFAGNGFITGQATRAGNTTNAKSDLEKIKSQIRFLNNREVQAFVHSEVMGG